MHFAFNVLKLSLEAAERRLPLFPFATHDSDIDSSMHGDLATVLLALAATAGIRAYSIGQRKKSYPPGPPTVPLIGNAHLVPKESIHLQ